MICIDAFFGMFLEVEAANMNRPVGADAGRAGGIYLKRKAY
jgi:hypothetical protein